MPARCYSSYAKIIMYFSAQLRPFTRLFTLFLLVAMLVGASACDGQEEEAPAPDPTPVARFWQMVASINTPQQRHEHAYVAVGDAFYLVGGRGQRPVQKYDPATKTWEDMSAPPFQMHHFQAVSYDGKIYVMGAFTDGYPDENPIPNIYIFDPETDTWTAGPEIPADRRRGSAGAIVYNNEFYIVAGIQNGHTDGHVTWLDKYNPATDTWTQLADAPRARDHFQAVVVDDKLYAAAGRRSSFATNQVFQLTEAAVDVYDFATDSWSTLPASANIPTERAGTAAIALDGKVVVLGGESGRQIPGMEQNPPLAHDEVEAYNPITGAWETLPPMLEGRHGTQAIVYDNAVYIAAGSKTLGGNEINSHEVFAAAEDNE